MIESGDFSRILAFDPGTTTGICFLENGSYRWGMIAIPASFFSDNFHRGLIIASKPQVIVVEEPPHGGFPNKDQQSVFQQLIRWYSVAGYDVRQILPGFWKKNIEPIKVEANPHIRDSIGMATWFYNKHRGNRNGKP